ncbi:DUF2909 domain-containing protein [Shewanella sp. AS16]|uniref:DUF2909 family protein n=1 Tax=Shewanella sp. AS16 TaxID=2907625 RepID=UPI001F3601A2|nr:DUF2909 family protein [Shewanella sp. AS16]MCE9686099.1 DUF2909 domain-containing protein [Shewanella sp. AS16]
MNTLFVFKVVLVLLLGFIIFNLGLALFALIKGEQRRPMSHYLGLRVLFSVLLVLMLLLALGSGLISPNPRPY